MSKDTVLITGAGIGIGHSSALAFARANYHVFVTDVLDKEGMETVAAIEAEGGTAEFHHLDVTDTANVDAVVKLVEASNGALNAVVANAGIAHKVLLGEMTDEKWTQTLDVNLSGVFRVLRAAAPAMQAAGKGAMVALSSVMGTTYGWHDHVQYNAAKSGVVGLVRGLACDLGPSSVHPTRSIGWPRALCMESQVAASAGDVFDRRRSIDGAAYSSGNTCVPRQSYGRQRGRCE